MRVIYHKNFWFYPAIFVFTLVCFLLRSDDRYFYEVPVTSTTRQLIVTGYSSRFVHVTKSMKELGKMDELSGHILFFTRVPYCGSEVLSLLLQWLQGWNNFRRVRLKDDSNRILNLIDQEQLVYHVHDVIKKKAVPLCFDQHVRFINFTKFDKQSPTFFSLIRDPADMILSKYNSFRNVKTKPNKILEDCANDPQKCFLTLDKFKDYPISYFCGQHKRCLKLNDDWALKSAKANVERYYPVVGILEEINATLEVFENKIPYFFKGVQNKYYRDILGSFQKQNINEKQKKNELFKNLVKSKLTKEYEFYKWVKARLFRQLQIIYGNSHH